MPPYKMMDMHKFFRYYLLCFFHLQFVFLEILNSRIIWGNCHDKLCNDGLLLCSEKWLYILTTISYFHICCKGLFSLVF
jgi:hypothetical protein